MKLHRNQPPDGQFSSVCCVRYKHVISICEYQKLKLIFGLIHISSLYPQLHIQSFNFLHKYNIPYLDICRSFWDVNLDFMTSVNIKIW